MTHKPIAIVLGGTNPHIALIENLKNRGYFTLLIDYYQNPPAKKYADEHIQESTLDKDKVLEIARNRKAELVISTCIDQANVTACYVAEKLGLPAPYSYEIAVNVSNKINMKKMMVETSIPTSKFCVLNSINNSDLLGLSYPLVAKPSDSTGSKGVRKVNNQLELNAALEQALNISRTKKVIVEEYKEGIEIGIDCYIHKQKAHILLIRQKCKIKVFYDIVEQSFGSLIPSDISESHQSIILNCAKKITHSFGLENTPLLLQAILSGDDINIIEFAPRIGGGLNYYTVNECTGFDIINATVDSFLGVEVNITNRFPKQLSAVIHIYAQPGIFGKISGHKALIENNIIKYFVNTKTTGMRIGPAMTSSDRIGSFYLVANDKKELFIKTQIAIDNLEVYDTYNNPIMRKDIYDFDKL